jgi:hypothetical protein
MLLTRRALGSTARWRFRVVLVKPSHYDDDGYVIRWYRSPMSANSPASVYGLIDDCARRQILGPDIDIDILAIAETNTRVRVDRIIADIRANNNYGFVGLEEVIRDAAAGRLQPVYNYIDDLPAPEDAITPFLPGSGADRSSFIPA